MGAVQVAGGAETVPESPLGGGAPTSPPACPSVGVTPPPSFVGPPFPLFEDEEPQHTRRASIVATTARGSAGSEIDGTAIRGSYQRYRRVDAPFHRKPRMRIAGTTWAPASLHAVATA